MKFIILISSLFILSSCSSMLLQPADFSWPLEAVVKVDGNGFIYEDRHTFSVNVKPIFFEEFSDSSVAAGKEIRIIRDKAGFYYITGEGFKNIYMFLPAKEALRMEDKINISDSLALKNPVLNTRMNNIELIDGTNKYLIKGTEIERVK